MAEFLLVTFHISVFIGASITAMHIMEVDRNIWSLLKKMAKAR
jgi:hypothetical protein